MEAEDAVAKLREAVRAGPRLRLAILFGSRACGTARPSSDFDVGIVSAQSDLTLRDELAFASALSAAVGAEVDVVRLEDADPLLGREVARDGVCLYEAQPGAFAAWRADAMSRWIEFDEILAPHRARYLERVARGAMGGTR